MYGRATGKRNDKRFLRPGAKAAQAHAFRGGASANENNVNGNPKDNKQMRLMDSYAGTGPAGLPAATFPRTRDNAAGTAFTLGGALILADIVALCMALVAASFVAMTLKQYVFHVPPYMSTAEAIDGRRNIFLVLGMIQIAMLWSKGLYAKRVPWWSQVQYIGKVVFFTCLIDGFLSFALKLYESRLLILSTWAFAFAFTVSLRWLGCRMAARMGLWSIPAVVIGDNATATDLMYALNADPCAGYKVHTIFLRDRDAGDFDVANLPRACRNVRIRDGLADYESHIRANPGDFYIVSLDTFRGETRDRLLKALGNANAAYAVVPSVTKAGLYEMEPDYFFGHDVIMMQPKASAIAAPATRLVKRLMDIAVAGCALAVLSPVFAGVALMLKLEGQGGSVYYGGSRIGKDGKRFSCWKFRSMEPDSDHLLHAYLDANPQAKADWEKYRKLPNDPRVTTRTARFIRKASIDELPQLWNVLTGDMSLVGPRPILEDEVAYFGDTLKEYLSVRPGITGLWQVSGRNATSFMRRVHWDSWYVRNWSLWGDIVILVKTPLVLLSRQGAH